MPSGRDYWQEFCRSCFIAADQRYDAFAFGDTPALADESLALVLARPKRATAALVAHFQRSGDALPETGVHSVVLNGQGEPGCVNRTAEVEVEPFDQVVARFAWDEGEDDRTLTSWIKGHRWYFMRQYASWGIPFDQRMPVVFERFELASPKRG